MGGVLAASDVTSGMTTALSTIGDVVTTAVGIITGNPILMVLFCGGLLGIGFAVVKKAKGAARS